MAINKGQVLLPIARAAIAEALGETCKTAEDAAWLQEMAACFVTLMQNNQLRGCIGTLHAHRTLLTDIKSNARAAALKDPRFSPLRLAELDYTEIEVSLLSPMQAMLFDNEHQALRQLQPGIDGVVLEYGHKRATFLPQVWQQLPDVEDFIAQLKYKAGLSTDFWSDEIKLQRYSVSKWKESDLRARTA